MSRIFVTSDSEDRLRGFMEAAVFFMSVGITYRARDARPWAIVADEATVPEYHNDTPYEVTAYHLGENGLRPMGPGHLSFSNNIPIWEPKGDELCTTKS